MIPEENIQQEDFQDELRDGDDLEGDEDFGDAPMTIHPDVTKNEERVRVTATAEQRAAQAQASTVTKKPPKRRWYIVHTYSGHENKVKVNLERRI